MIVNNTLLSQITFAKALAGRTSKHVARDMRTASRYIFLTDSFSFDVRSL